MSPVFRIRFSAVCVFMISLFSRPPVPARLSLVGRRNQPTAVFITRLVLTAVAAYVMALALLPSRAPLLAPLTALLVVQVSLYQTIRHAGQRVVSVTAGVIVAVVLVGMLGFTWWSLGVAIGASLVLGYALRLGDHILEVPISAMLILQLGTETAAAERVVETLIGAGVGLLAGLIASPVRVQSAEEAIGELCRSMGGLLGAMADGLATEPGKKTVGDWLERSRTLGGEIQRVTGELDAAEESLRLNPRALGAAPLGVALRGRLETLEYATVTLRGLTRSMADRTGLVLADRGGLGAEMWEADVRERLAAVLRELAKAARAYGTAASLGPGEDPGPSDAELNGHLVRGRGLRDELGKLLREDPGHWPLHGELLVHLDRLLDGLRADDRPWARTPGRWRPPGHRSRAATPRKHHLPLLLRTLRHQVRQRLPPQHLSRAAEPNPMTTPPPGLRPDPATNGSGEPHHPPRAHPLTGQLHTAWNATLEAIGTLVRSRPTRAPSRRSAHRNSHPDRNRWHHPGRSPRPRSLNPGLGITLMGGRQNPPPDRGGR